ncbi:MAG: peptidase domain-containing ABC transporter [Bacteroidetes bacterium]|nr:peptidase domain-containing ABC transporter [Bacteroidota bacterium]
MKSANRTKFSTHQIDESDCGVACLSSVIIFYDGFVGIEELRELSGTTKFGTTLLGLYQAAEKCGFSPRGLKVNSEYLKEITHPVILHVVIDSHLHHYVVLYYYKNGVFVIGDPARGLVKYKESELENIWASKYILELEVNEKFVKVYDAQKKKKRWFFDLFKKDIFPLTSIVIIGFFIATIGLSVSIFTQQLIDNIIPARSIDKLQYSLIGLGLLVLLKSWLTYVRGQLLNQQGRNFNNRIIDFFFRNLLHLPKTFFSNRKIGELVARMDDTTRIQTVIAYIFGDFMKETLIVFISFIILFFYSNKVGLVILASIPIFLFLSLIFHKKVVNSQRELMASNAHKTSNYINTMQSIDTIKANNKQLQFADINRIFYGLFQEKVWGLNKIGISLQLLTDIISALFLISAIWYSSILLLRGNLKTGEFIAIISIVASILPLVSSLTFVNTRVQGAKIAFNRIYEFASVKPEDNNDNLEDGTNDNRLVEFNNITLERIHFGFAGHKLLLKDISLTISKGQITCLVGESGSGKTSLLNLLGRFYHPVSGSILADGVSSEVISLHHWRDSIGIMQQEVDIVNGTVIYNICLSNSTEDYAKVQDFSREYGFDIYFKKFQKGFDTLLGEEGTGISGGQKQLIGLARVLYKKPKILLLDEPTSAMDTNMESFVIQLVKQITNQTGVMLITHKQELMLLTDQIYTLKNGEIHSVVKNEIPA